MFSLAALVYFLLASFLEILARAPLIEPELVRVLGALPCRDKVRRRLYAIAATRDSRYQQQAYPSAAAQSAIARTSFFRAGEDGSALNEAYPTFLTGVKSFVVDNT